MDESVPITTQKSLSGASLSPGFCPQWQVLTWVKWLPQQATTGTFSRPFITGNATEAHNTSLMSLSDNIVTKDGFEARFASTNDFKSTGLRSWGFGGEKDGKGEEEVLRFTVTFDCDLYDKEYNQLKVINGKSTSIIYNTYCPRILVSSSLSNKM